MVGTGIGAAAGSALAMYYVNSPELKTVSEVFDSLDKRLDPKDRSYSKLLSGSEVMQNTFIKDTIKNIKVKSYITAGLALLGCAAAGFGIGSLFNKSGTPKDKA